MEGLKSRVWGRFGKQAYPIVRAPQHDSILLRTCLKEDQCRFRLRLQRVSSPHLRYCRSNSIRRSGCHQLLSDFPAVLTSTSQSFFLPSSSASFSMASTEPWGTTPTAVHASTSGVAGLRVRPLRTCPCTPLEDVQGRDTSPTPPEQRPTPPPPNSSPFTNTHPPTRTHLCPMTPLLL